MTQIAERFESLTDFGPHFRHGCAHRGGFRHVTSGVNDGGGLVCMRENLSQAQVADAWLAAYVVIARASHSILA